MENHPIQLRLVAVRELQIRSFYPPDMRLEFDSMEAKLETTISTFNPVTHLIQVGISLTSGRSEDPTEDEIELMRANREQPFQMRVHIIGEFWVDVENFPLEKLGQWSQVSAPVVLYPFLREQVYSLTLRCGYSPMLMPLITVPVFKMAREAVPSAPPIPVRESELVGK